MTKSDLFDSTIWLDYLIKGSFKEKIERDEIFMLSSLSLFEIKRKLLKNKALKRKEIEEKVAFIKSKSIIVSVDERTAEKAADIAEEKELGAADAIIYTTALLTHTTLYTLDNDFRGFDKATVL